VQLANGKTKTLVYMDGCDPALGCTLILRGSADYRELTRVKSVVNFLVYVAYAQGLEIAMLQSQFSMPFLAVEGGAEGGVEGRVTPAHSGGGMSGARAGAGTMRGAAARVRSLSPVVGSAGSQGIVAGLGSADGGGGNDDVIAHADGLATTTGDTERDAASSSATLGNPLAPWYGKSFPVDDEGWSLRSQGFADAMSSVALSTSVDVKFPIP